MLPPHHRQHRLAILLLLVSCCCSLIAPIESSRSRDKEGRRRNDRVSASASASTSASLSSNHYSSSSYMSSTFSGPPDTTGFCTRHRDMKLMCYCTPDENHVPVQKAECWIFADGLLENDTTWTRFFQQKRLRDLKFVVQNHGRLDYIPTAVLEPLKNLSSITIEYSQVEVVKSYAFANLAHLERIVLTNNHIMALSQDAFANHMRLHELNLEHNQIYEIDRHAFRNLPQCERLFLNNNNISNLHEGLFADMARLVYLNLAHNQISVLTSEIFKGLGNLNVLKLTHNNLNFIGDTVFAELWSLNELELDDNRIERISERALDGLNNLKTLNLRNNLLKKIDNGLLRGTPALLSINVQSNELETLTFYTFQPIMDNLVNSTSELLLSDNNFVCDCRLGWIYELKNRTRHQQLRDSLEEFVCTLHEAKLSNFIEPVPNHILDLLNVGSYSSELQPSSIVSGRKRLPKSRNLATPPRQQRSQKQALEMQLTSALVVGEAEKQELQRRRKRRSLGQLDGGTSKHAPMELNRKQSSSSPAHSAAAAATPDYYDEAHGMMAQQVDLADDNLDMLKQNALFSQHGRQSSNDVQFASNKLDEGGSSVAVNEAEEDDGNALSKQTLGIKVRLFTLKSDGLPCHDELSDPTELPLSRDLMDVRSNVLSVNSSAAALAGAGRGRRTLQPLIMMLTALMSLIVVGMRTAFDRRVG